MPKFLPRVFAVRFLSAFLSFCFLTTQVSASTQSAYMVNATDQRDKSVDMIKEGEDLLSDMPGQPPLDVTTAFLNETLTLTQNRDASIRSAAKEKDVTSDTQAGEPERYAFDDAVELLRPDFAAAVIVESLSADNLKDLLDLDIEVGVAVLHGEYVLFTSGDGGEIMLSEGARNLVSEASLIGHTHPFGYQESGASDLDLENAGLQPEFVVTEKGVYEYNRAGVLAEFSFSAFSERLQQKVLSDRNNEEYKNSVGARRVLNGFIAEIEALNSNETVKDTFRSGGDTPDFTDDFNRTTLGADWQALSGTWLTVNNQLYHYIKQNSQDKLLFNKPLDSSDYDVSASFKYNDIYSNYRGLVARYQDEQNYLYAQVSAYNGNFYVFKYVNGVRTVLANGYLFQFIGGNPPGHLQTNTPYRIRLRLDGDQIRFYIDDVLLAEVEDSELTGRRVGVSSSKNANYIDDFSLTYLNMEYSLTRPAVDEVNEFSPNPEVRLSGTKESGTGIWVNGEMKVAPNSGTTWETNEPMPQPGDYSFDVQAGDGNGEFSPAVSVATQYKPIGPSAYYDYFDENPLGTNWTVEHGNWSVSDGKLRPEYSSPDPRGWLTLDHTLGSSDYSVEADFTVSSSTNRTEKGFLARYQDENNYYYAYVEKLYSYQYIKIIKVVNGQYTQLASLYDGSPDLNYNLRLVVEGNRLELYLDDVLKISTLDDSLAAGTTGLKSYFYGDTIDNFLVDVIGALTTPVLAPEVTSEIPEFVNQNTVTLTGTNQEGTSVWVNGSEATQISTTTWSLEIALQNEGVQNRFEVTARDTQNVSSDPVIVLTTFDQTDPQGTVSLNQGEVAAYKREVVADFTATDEISGIDQISYSWDGENWEAWQNFTSPLDLTILGEEGAKTLYYRVRDNADNISTFSDDIELVLTAYADDFHQDKLRTEWLQINGVFQTDSIDDLYHAYHFSGVSAPSMMILDLDYETDNFDTSADFTYVTGSSSERTGIVSRYQNANNFYLGALDADGSVRILKYLAGQVTVLSSGNLGSPVNLLEPQNVRLITQGDKLELYINGVLVASAEDAEFETGKSGLAATLIASRIDNFELHMLPVSETPEITVDALSEWTSGDSVTLRGTKTENTSVWINGQERVPASSSTSWEYTFDFPSDGNFNFSLASKTQDGNESDPVQTQIIHLTATAEIYSNDFSGTSLGGEWIGNVGSWGIAEGELKAPQQGGRQSVLVLDPQSFPLPAGVVDIEASFYYARKYTNNRGLIANYQDSNNYYRAILQGNGVCLIEKFVNGTKTTLATGYMGTGIVPGTYYDLRFRIDGNNYLFYVNNVLLAEKEDPSFAGGGAGFYSLSSTYEIPPLTIDDFLISKPPVAQPYFEPLGGSIATESITINGYKDPATSIWINGEEVVPADGELEWSYQVTGLEEGKRKQLTVSARDIAGNESLQVELSIYREIEDVVAFTLNANMAYFESEFGLIEETSGYPFEGWERTDYTQPTAIGFYAMVLANVITGEIVTPSMTVEQAKSRLTLLMQSLLRDQAAFGYKGLLPWMGFENGVWGPRAGTTEGQSVVTGDNVNLTAALGSVVGALLDPALDGDAEIQSIVNDAEAFMDAQGEGYNFLYDAGAGKMRRGYYLQTGGWVGGATAHHEVFTDEFRSGLLFITMRYGLDESVYSKLGVSVVNYEKSNGEVVQTLAPYDGGAFQMLWPLLLMPEYEIPGMQNLHEAFVDLELDFSKTHDLQGFLSASYVGSDQYAGNAGIAAVAENSAARNETTASLYTLGAAHMVNPEEVEVFLRDILRDYPDVVSEHGLWEGVRPGGAVIGEQIVANVATFALGMAGTGPSHMRRYLEAHNLYSQFQSVHAISTQTADFIADNTYESYVSRSGTFTYGTVKSKGRIGVSGSDFRSARQSYNQDSINMSGQTIQIRYRLTGDPVDMKLEFRDTTNIGFRPTLSLPGIELTDTNGGERVLMIDLLATPALSDIRSMLIQLDRYTGGGPGGPIELEILDLDLI